jgi:hypothetical protein
VVLDTEGTGPESVKGPGKEKDLGTVPGKGTDLGIKIGMFDKIIPLDQILTCFLKQESKEEPVT